MKYFCLVFILFTQVSHASPSKIVKCLGQEEQRIHQKKIGGAYYYLNQEMISFLVQFPDNATFKSRVVQDVCQEKSSESLQLLRLFLTLDTGVFESPKKHSSRPNTSREDILKKSLKIFLSFLSRYQDGLKNSQCLNQKIPSLKSFLEKTRYFETDVKITQLIKQLKNVDVIIDKLLTPSLIEDC